MFMASLIAQLVKYPHLQCRTPQFDSWVGKIRWRRDRLPTPVFWPGEFQWLYSPWRQKESDTTEQLSLSLSYLHDIFIISSSSFLITTMGHLFPTIQRPKGRCINQGCGWKQWKLSQDVLGKKVHTGKLWDAHTMDWQLEDQTLKTCHKGTTEAPIWEVNQLFCRRKHKAADQILCPPGDHEATMTKF